MRAYLINPKDRTITEVDYNGDFHQIYEHIQAKCFDIVILNKEGDTIFVDDEGLSNGTVQRVGMFRVEGRYPAYLAGYALVTGRETEDDDTKTDDVSVSPEELKKLITFGYPVNYGGRMMFWSHDEVKCWDMDKE